MSKINRPRASRASCAFVTGRIEPVHRVHSVHRVPGQIDPVHRVQFRVGFKYKYFYFQIQIYLCFQIQIGTLFVFKYLKKKTESICI